jgi:maltose O-acetyltransferase
MTLGGTLRRMAVNLAFMSHATPNSVRAWGLNKAGISVGAGTQVRSRSTIKTLDVSIGTRSFMNHGCHIDDGKLTIGDGVYVGPHVVFAMGDHEIGPASQRAGSNLSRPIDIQDGSWIGASATILSGVTVAPGCIIAAGAVVTKSTEPNGLYAGVPARRVKDLP